MQIIGKQRRGYVVRCDCRHTFLVPNLTVGVECPSCGATALAVDLVTDYLTRDKAIEEPEAA